MKKQILTMAALVALAGMSHPAAATAPGGCGQVHSDFPCCTDFVIPSGGSDDERTCVGPARSYSMTMYDFGFEDSNGNVIHLGSGKIFDAAAVNAGEVAGSFISHANLPSGTYVAVRPIVSHAIEIESDITVQNGTGGTRRCYGTATGGNPTIHECNENFRDPEGDDTCQKDGKQYIRDTQLGTFTYKEGDPLNFRFAIYVDSSVRCTFLEGGFGDTIPQVGEIKVDMFKD